MTASADPPYLRIAGEIRRRIAAGELAPGDRVPSTRQIARQQGVALATAAKALAALQHEGLVHTRPRAGTVVAPPEPVPPPTRHQATAGRDRELTRERIVRAAIEIADAEGLDALSMRGVAARLGVAVMSPYRYVTSKDDLILLMADAAFGEHGCAAQPPPGWRARMELAARDLWALYRRHPWLAQLSPLTRPLSLPGLMDHAEWVLNALDDLGLAPRTTRDLLVLAYSYVQGIAANIEREAQAEAATGLSGDQWTGAQAGALAAIAASGRYPAFTKISSSLVEHGDRLDLDEIFEFGLPALLDGLGVLIERATRERRSGP